MCPWFVASVSLPDVWCEARAQTQARWQARVLGWIAGGLPPLSCLILMLLLEPLLVSSLGMLLLVVLLMMMLVLVLLLLL